MNVKKTLFEELIVNYINHKEKVKLNNWNSNLNKRNVLIAT